MSAPQDQLGDVPADAPLDFIDLLLALAENIWLIVIAALVAGAAGLALSPSKVTRFESEILIDPLQNMPVGGDVETVQLRNKAVRQIPAVLEAPATVAAAAARIGLEVSDLPARAASVTPRRDDNLVQVRVTGHTAEQTRQLTQALLEEAYAQLAPPPEERALLEQQAKELQAEVDDIERTLQLVQQRLNAQPIPSDFGNLVTGLAMTRSNHYEAQRKLFLVQARLRILSPESVYMEATPPQEQGRVRSSIAGLIGLLAGAFVMTVFVLLRHGMQRLPLSATQRTRLQSLKARYRRQG